MPVVQDAFYIPDDIATGLATGLYRRIGSVVRYAVGPNKGHIVKHLKPIDLKVAEEAQGIGVKALQFVKEHKKGTIITVAAAEIVGTGAFVYSKVKNHEPKVVTEFRTALRVYIDAIREGNMDIDIINNTMDALEELKQHKNYEKISIQLATKDLEVLVGRIYEYTIKLAKDNDVELPEDELRASHAKTVGTIINLQNYLKAQKRIFEATA
ncbi:hypothetical protein [Acutalibacter muris]|uniref:hypothetical protein n=1 Tax=Acutalibacter muris TaxID=1796620 RepID=UPI00272D7F96|nr:hypothetical protein [Acutalibacter muris]